MIFDSSNEAASYELSLDEMRKNPDINWYLWRLDAQNEEDTADFTQFASLLKKQPNGEVPLSLLTEWGIGLTRSQIVRNLLREKLAATTDKELQLTFPRIDSDNIDSWETKLSEYYHSNAQTERMKILRFPSSYFCLIDRSVCVTVPVQNLGWYSFDTPSYEHKLIEITFPRFHIPPVMVTATAIEELILTAKEKIIYKLSQTAAENNGFFSRYVKFDGFSIKNRFPTPFEADLISLKNKKGQDYQFGYTQIFLDKVFAKPETAAEYMDAVNFESYSDLSVLFSPSKRENYDFIQSYLIYKELVLPLNHTQKEATEKLNTALAGALRFYMTEDEIKEQILLILPDSGKEFHEKIFADFQKAIEERDASRKDPTVLSFDIDFYGNRESIFFYASNFNRYLNKTLSDTTDPIEKQIRIDWKKKLSKYRFEPEMFSDTQFNKLIFELIRSRDSVLYQILIQKKCQYYLSRIHNLNRLSQKLVLFGIFNMAETLKLDPHKIYAQTVEEIKKEKSFFGRLIFRFFNWYYLRAYRNMREHPAGEETALPKSESGEAPVLAAAGVSAVSQIDGQCDRIWSELGADQIPRQSLESNIKTDLLEYFKNRDRIVPSGLDIIFERNANRIVKKAPHLAVYREKLLEFIKLYSYKIIALTPSLRAKFQGV